MPSVLEFESLLSQLTMSDLNKLHSDLYMEYSTAPLWDTGATKSQQVRNFTYWVRGEPAKVARVIEMAKAKIQEKQMIPKGLAEGTRYMTKEEIQALPSYPELIEAIEFPSQASKRGPFTRDEKYVAVSAIYNMNAWASWKSSSLSDYERAKASAVDDLHLGDLMTLNRGRRMDSPALFPASGLLRG